MCPEQVPAEAPKRSPTPFSELRRRCESLPHAPTVSDPWSEVDGEGLLRIVGGIASVLPDGVGRFGIVMDHSIAMVASIFAVLSKGSSYVPVEPSFPRERTAYILRDSGAGAVITDRQDVGVYGLPVVALDDIPEGDPPEDRSDPEGIAYVLYTSGTTGRPKGVAVRNRNILHYVDGFRAEFSPGPGDVMIQHSVCTFDIFVEEVFASLLSGAELAILPEDVRGDAVRLADFVGRRNVTIVSGFPYLMQDLNRLPSIPSCVRLLISGGDVLRHGYVDRLLGVAEVYNTYGPSETTVCCTYHRCNDGPPLPDGTYPIGRPIPGTGILLLDEDLRPVGPGEVGEICISGGGVSAGYVGAGSSENGSFVTMGDGTVTYRSGDMGLALPDGELAFLHRRDSQVMILGRRVEPLEVEDVLFESGLVRNAVVRSGKDAEELAHLIAYIVPEPGVGDEEIRGVLSEFLPDYMIPEHIVRLSAIPLNPNGKVDSAALPDVPGLRRGR